MGQPPHRDRRADDRNDDAPAARVPAAAGGSQPGEPLSADREAAVCKPIGHHRAAHGPPLPPCATVARCRGACRPGARATGGVPTSGLMEDLRTVAAGLDFPIKDACLSAQSDDDECVEYTRLQVAADHADIIFTTHAMLAMRTIALSRGNKPPIPQPYALLVDEAHALEDGFAAVNGASLAMSRLGPSLKGDACKEAWTQAFLALQSMPEEITLPHPPGNDKTTRAWNLAKGKLHALRDQ